MGRREERLFRINDEIAALRRDEHRAREELIMLGHLDDDAQRDAVVSGQTIDAADARKTAADVERMGRHVRDIQAALERLERIRDRTMAKLGS